MSGDVYRTLARRAHGVFKTGHGVIVDAVCADPMHRAILSEVARVNGVPFTGLWLEAPLDTLTTRLKARVDDASEATPEVAAVQLEQRSVPGSWTVLDASHDSNSVWRKARRVVST